MSTVGRKVLSATSLLRSGEGAEGGVLGPTYHIATDSTIKGIRLQVNTITPTRCLSLRTLAITFLLGAHFKSRAADPAVNDIGKGIS